MNAYEQDLRQFLESTPAGEGVGRLVRADVVSFLDARMAAGAAEATRARQLSSIRRFFTFLHQQSVVTANPTELIEALRLPFRLPTILAQEEIVRLLEAPSKETPEGIRDRAILEFMYAAGARVSETVGLKLANVYLAERLVLVEGKGRKQRMVPLAGAAARKLEFYLENTRSRLLRSASRPYPDARTVVFVSRRGKGLTRQGVWKLLKKYSAKAGLTDEVHPHMLRHCFATHMLVNGADLRVVQVLLGHENITTTEVYTHLSREDLRAAYKKHHPRA